jgi:hypothetical protein
MRFNRQHTASKIFEVLPEPTFHFKGQVKLHKCKLSGAHEYVLQQSTPDGKTASMKCQVSQMNALFMGGKTLLHCNENHFTSNTHSHNLLQARGDFPC